MAYGSDEATLHDFVETARSKLFAPALLLIILAGCNLVLGAITFVQASQVEQMSDDEIKQMHAQQVQQFGQVLPQLRDMMNQQAQQFGGPVPYHRAVARIQKWTGGFIVIASLLCIVAGARMLVVKSYGLGITGSFLMIIASVPTLCCCGLGLVIGIWNIVVLFNQDVRDGFRANAELTSYGAGQAPPPDDYFTS